MNALRNTNPILITSFEVFNPNKIVRKFPVKSQAVKSLGDIQKLDLNCDWEMYSDLIRTYCLKSGITLLETCTDGVIEDYFNANEVKDNRIYEFLENHTSTYFYEA